MSLASVSARQVAWVLGSLLISGLLLRAYLHFFVFKLFADDAYIFLRYAQNAAAGNGLVFNVGEPVMGFTSPLFVLILAGFAYLGANLETVLIVFNGALFVALSLVILRTSRTEHRLWWLFPLLWAFYLPFIDASVNGMETMLFMALQWAALLLLQRGRSDWAIGCAALSALTRPEGVLFALALLVAMPFSEKRRFPVYGVAAGLVIGAAWAFYAQTTYGSVIPQSILAKSITMQAFDRQHVGVLGTFVSMSLGVSSDTVRLIPEYQRLALLAFCVSMGLVFLYGAWRLFKQRSTFAALPIFFVLAWAFYVVGDPVRIWSWYAIPPAAAFWWTTCYALGLIWERRRAHIGWAVGFGVFAALACMLSLRVGVPKRQIGLIRQTAKLQYVAKLVSELYPDAKSIMLGDIGIVGYKTNLRIIDLAGLVSPIGIAQGEDGKIVSFDELVKNERPDVICLRDDPTTRDVIRDGLIERQTFPVRHNGPWVDIDELSTRGHAFELGYQRVIDSEIAPYFVFVHRQREADGTRAVNP